MNSDDFYNAYSFANQREAQKRKSDVLTASYPHSKKSWQDKYFKDLDRSSRDQLDDSPAHSTHDLALFLSGKGGKRG